MPFFSVVIPIYNRAGFFPQTVQSLFDQSFRDFEIIVVDDGSTDNIREVVDGLSGRHPELKYIRQENSERGCARNNGIRNAEGEYVVLLDSDDRMHADHLATLHARMAGLKFPDFIATKFDFVHEGRHRPSDVMKLREGYYDYRLFLRGNPLACNICFKNHLPGFFPFEEDRKYSMLEDWMFFLQNMQRFKLYLVDKVTLSMMDHDSRSMQSNHARLIAKAADAFEWMRKHVPLSDSEIRVLHAQIHYFSAIHSYLAGNREQTTALLRKAIKSDGLRMRYAALFLKSAIGHTHLHTLKKRIGKE